MTMLELFAKGVGHIAWQWILLPCVLVGGLRFTLQTRAIQLRRLGRSLRLPFSKAEKSAGTGSLTPFQAVSTALASTVGTGNIIGTGQAIAMGGFGAVFWLWMAAILEMVIKYAEIVLSLRHRQRDERGEWVGGPMYYIRNGLGRRFAPLAGAFCLFTIFASFGIGNLSQVHAMLGSIDVAAAAFGTAIPAWVRWAAGSIIAALAAVVLFGGMKRLGQVCQVMVPVMCGAYILLTLGVLCCRATAIPSVLGRIVTAAFRPSAVAGAGAGIAVRQGIVWGLRRSAFSNEAGLGSAAISHAAAETNSPARQGLYGIFEVFVDTIVICTLTALVILLSGVPIPYGTLPGVHLIVSAFASVYGGKLSALAVGVCMLFFAFSTLLGWSLYGMRCAQFLAGAQGVWVYRCCFIAVTVLCAGFDGEIIWVLADCCNGLMAIPNWIALFALSYEVREETERAFGRKKLANCP